MEAESDGVPTQFIMILNHILKSFRMQIVVCELNLPGIEVFIWKNVEMHFYMHGI